MNTYSKIVINGNLLDPPEGLQVRNFHDPVVPRFRGKNRCKTLVTEIIVHETVTQSVEATIRVLQRRKLGVHFIIGPNGEVTQHGDLAIDLLFHAGFHNRPSVGIEVVNPYYPRYRKEDAPWTETIDAPWAHEGAYVVPTAAQAEATALLVDWLSSEKAEGLHIPENWIGLGKKGMALGRVLAAKRRKPGIYAHHYFGHADGAWLILYCWLRFEAGLDSPRAYDEAIKRTVGVKKFADVNTVER
ncbi:MAG: N-acetylmuramoyl-L-alanine amidase [Deltaproteobacteria bacterium]|nr:N-acetylmuramoyl-L-alanine amidase [Deltaproteobacteria bacterium]